MNCPPKANCHPDINVATTLLHSFSNVLYVDATVPSQHKCTAVLQICLFVQKVVDAEVKVLLELKQQLKDLTGEDTAASGGSGKKKGKGKTAKPSEQPSKQTELSKESKPATAAAGVGQDADDDSEAKKHLSRLVMDFFGDTEWLCWHSLYTTLDWVWK